MPRTRPRWILGLARRRLVAAAKRLRGRLRLQPRSVRGAGRPTPRRRGRPALRLSHALLACDLNEAYLDCWELAARAWTEIAQVEPVLVLIAEPEAVPARLRDDQRIRVFPPLPKLHTAFQAQCIRLLYPALLSAEGAVIVSDADLMPMNHSYFHRPLRRIDPRDFVAYRSSILELGEIFLCYNAARPSVWAEVFEVDSLDAVRARLADWGQGIEYDGTRALGDWLSDQRILCRTVLDFGRRTGRAWVLDDHDTGFRRLERADLHKRGLSAAERRAIAHGRYSDFHCVLPFREHRELNEKIVEFAIRAQR